MDGAYLAKDIAEGVTDQGKNTYSTSNGTEYDFMKQTEIIMLNYYKKTYLCKKNKSMTNNDIFKKLRVY
jgi:hypothetical protein